MEIEDVSRICSIKIKFVVLQQKMEEAAWKLRNINMPGSARKVKIQKVMQEAKALSQDILHAHDSIANCKCFNVLVSLEPDTAEQVNMMAHLETLKSLLSSLATEEKPKSQLNPLSKAFVPSIKVIQLIEGEKKIANEQRTATETQRQNPKDTENYVIAANVQIIWNKYPDKAPVQHIQDNFVTLDTDRSIWMVKDEDRKCWNPYIVSSPCGCPPCFGYNLPPDIFGNPFKFKNYCTEEDIHLSFYKTEILDNNRNVWNFPNGIDAGEEQSSCQLTVSRQNGVKQIEQFQSASGTSKLSSAAEYVQPKTALSPIDEDEDLITENNSVEVLGSAVFMTNYVPKSTAPRKACEFPCSVWCDTNTTVPKSSRPSKIIYKDWHKQAEKARAMRALSNVQLSLSQTRGSHATARRSTIRPYQANTESRVKCNGSNRIPVHTSQQAVYRNGRSKFVSKPTSNTNINRSQNPWNDKNSVVDPKERHYSGHFDVDLWTPLPDCKPFSSYRGRGRGRRT